MLSIPKSVRWVVLGGVAVAGLAFPKPLGIPSLHAVPLSTSVQLWGTVRDFRAGHDDFHVSSHIRQTAGNVATSLAADWRPTFNAGADELGPFEDRVAHWTFDEGSGLTASDALGLNPGTLTNSPTWTPGRDGTGIHFDGINDYVEVPNSDEMQVNGDVTFSGWFKLDNDFDSSSPDTMVIMEKFLDTEHDFHIALAGLDYNRGEVPKGALVFKVENGPTSDYYRYTWTNRVSWTAGTWYHFACALTSSSTGDNRIMINGIENTSSIDAGGVGFTDTGYDAPMRIGGKTIDYNGHATDIYFEGVIDDIVIFDRALTGSDFTPNAGGYRVQIDWEDAAGEPIAPHTFTDASEGILDACGSLVSDIMGTRGGNHDGGITNADTFNQWFRDDVTVNMSILHDITLTLSGTVYEYLDDDFHPINDRLLGNEPDESVNDHFTYAIPATFTYHSCQNQYFEFEGGDGAWAFINGVLVLDIGGAQAGAIQRIDLDRLGLADGDPCQFDLFYANRNDESAIFRFRTNVGLATTNPTTVSAGFD